MKVSTLALALTCSVSSVAALDTLAGYTKDFPKCSYSAFKKAMESENCEVDNVDSSSFECLCRHSSGITVAMYDELKGDIKCSTDFIEALGWVCGVWEDDDSSAYELAQATSVLGEQLKGNSPATTKGKSATGTATATAADAAATSTNLAAMQTPGSGVVGIFGGAIALAAWVM